MLRGRGCKGSRAKLRTATKRQAYIRAHLLGYVISELHSRDSDKLKSSSKQKKKQEYDFIANNLVTFSCDVPSM